MALLILSLSLILAPACFARHRILLIATTTSTDNTGLLDYLAPQFQKDTGIELKWVAVGTGKALALGRNCDVSALLVHAPQAEKHFIKANYGIKRTPIMYNDFVIIGPNSDLANIKGNNATNALKKIAETNSIFISRGDDSGTNKKEKQLWQKAKITPPKKSSWYLQSGQGMMATIGVTNEKNGYTLTDRGTYIKYAANHDGKPSLIILTQNDKALKNQYSLITINPKRCENTKYNSAKQFRKWLVSKKTQANIDNYKLLNKTLFIANAK